MPVGNKNSSGSVCWKFGKKCLTTSVTGYVILRYRSTLKSRRNVMESSGKLKIMIYVMIITLFGISGSLGFATYQEIIKQKSIKASTFKVSMDNGMIMYRVKVSRNRAQEAVLTATRRSQNFGGLKVFSMPKGEGDVVDVFFFNPNRVIDKLELENEYEIRGLKPVDPYSLAAVNEFDPNFANEHSHITFWKDSEGTWLFLESSVFWGVPYIRVHSDFLGWGNMWWFAGLRK